MATIIDPSDRRTAKALEILSESGQWLKCRDGQGRKLYGIPSQSADGVYHLTNALTCSCEDHQRHPDNSCKHMLSVQMLVVTHRYLTGGK